MRISEAFAVIRTTKIDFGGGAILTVKYRASATTLKGIASMLDDVGGDVVADPSLAAGNGQLTGSGAEMAEMRKRIAVATETITSEILGSVTEWDLEDEEGGIVPLTFDRIVEIPTEILTRIINEIKTGQQATGGK